MENQPAPTPNASPEEEIGPPDQGGQRLMKDWSMEVTLPKTKELEAMAAHLVPGTRIYLSALPHIPPERLLQNARLVASHGLQPVPHIAVRNYQSREHLRDTLAVLTDEGLTRRILVIAGDRLPPAGPFASTLQLLDSGLLREAGIEHIDIAGYPEGHPKIPRKILLNVLRAKVNLARSQKLAISVLTQFCFDPKTIMSWLLQIRFDFPDLHIGVGLAGPADATTLLKYALRCGVKTTARGLGRGLLLIRKLNGETTPSQIIEKLTEGGEAEKNHPFSFHFYSFGGPAKTAAWANSLSPGSVAR